MTAVSDLAKLDRLVHEPVRLALLTALAQCQSADFTFLRQLLGVTAGNLNTHLCTLEAGGLVAMRRAIRGRMTHTTVSLTRDGRGAIDAHWKQLDALRAAVAAPDVRTRLRQAAANT